ncbi:hypothetical protein GGF37_004554 [Kickxella alabastrina]|nr:hypothetical protein GGF37_004554 [Kickxella alabastrina]
MSPGETQAAGARVLQEVRWFRHTSQVAVQSQRRCEKELHTYSKRKRGLEDAITEGDADVERLGDRLEESRSHKCHRIAYDEIAAEANKYPSRQKLQLEIDELNNEIEQLRQEEAAHDTVVASLRTQYATVHEELRRLADMSATALSTQDLGIIMADADGDAEPHPSIGVSPATPHQPGNAHPVFGSPADDMPLGARDDDEDDDDDKDTHGKADDNRECNAGARNPNSEGTDNEEDGALDTADDNDDDDEDNNVNANVSVGVPAQSPKSPDEGGIVSEEEEEGECEDEEGELLG